ncbi:helix-turn-helix domain-containing protein [Desulfurococcus amylolyticus]|uniref:helix-turn-helix domain-containing protein n=1 Tax=Desulfurococcus amylolyticus TaxID=94694 RepID=UPI0023F21CB6|nr:helix-turn-helix domain-containing protein [Desulfurococcus amylolyticus]
MSKKREKAEKALPPELALTSPDLTGESLAKVEKEIVRAEDPYVTPSTIAQKYGVKVNTAKKILRLLEEKGLVKLVSRTRRTGSTLS